MKNQLFFYLLIGAKDEQAYFFLIHYWISGNVFLSSCSKTPESCTQEPPIKPGTSDPAVFEKYKTSQFVTNPCLITKRGF